MKSYLLAGILLFFGAIAMKVIFDDVAAQRAYRSNVKAHAMLTLGGVLRDYKHAGGTLPDGESAPTSIPLPHWLSPSTLDGLTMVRASGREYVVGRYENRGEALRVRTAAQQRAEGRVGVAEGGKLLLLGGLGEAQALPSSIPDGALVLPL